MRLEANVLWSQLVIPDYVVVLADIGVHLPLEPEPIVGGGAGLLERPEVVLDQLMVWEAVPAEGALAEGLVEDLLSPDIRDD